ncbi:MAG: NAD(P)/FAD-dependent oxidoreductase [Nitriliruptoraceae bacterium]
MRIAVVGTGIAGAAAAWLLSRRHEVDVFEREARPGGHTHTVAAARGDGTTVPVDTGFIVYNEATYPLLVRLFDELGVATQASDMSWSLRCERCDLEYAGSARGIVAQPSNLSSPAYLRMLGDIARFNRLGSRLVEDPRTTTLTIGRFLEVAGFGHGFRHHYLLPMAAAIWSSGTGAIEGFPLATLLRFFANHGLLGVTTHHAWRTVVGGTSSYLAPLTAPYRDRLHLGTPVTAVHRDRSGVDLLLGDGRRHRADAVVLATHADEALALLAAPSAREKELLSAWEYSINDTWLHTDASLLPRRPAAWASWNYLLDDCTRPTEHVSLSYHMNRLQSLSEPREYIVTLNPSTPPAAGSVLRRLTYTHPRYTRDSVQAQTELDELNGRQRTFFVGAYQRYGFHEDGLWSAIRAAQRLGVRWPT